jgi:hypothetical protein
MLPQQWRKPSDSWFNPWVLSPAGAVCFLAMLIWTGVMSQHPASLSSITTSGGQSYSIHIGGNPTKSSAANMAHAETAPKNMGKPALASQTLVRINQTDETQYASAQEHDTWADSTCSTASMVEVLNAYGYHYRITDVLQVEARIGAISSSLGLLYPTGIDDTAQQFGFVTTTLNTPTISWIVDTANQGTPVIVNFYGAPDWTAGHFLVVVGGNHAIVKVVDSSIVNHGQGMQDISYAYFQTYWHGYAKILKPSGH